MAKKVFALSDVHVDFEYNIEWLQSLPEAYYKRDILILAGDVSHDLEKLKQALLLLRHKFGTVTFVPGNHDLWIRKGDTGDSFSKFESILNLCNSLEIKTSPFKIEDPKTPVWIVPLFSWYEKPEEGGHSLFLEKPGEDASLRMWSDNYFTKWPHTNGKMTVAEYFLSLNKAAVERVYDAPVITFSHFLPRRDLIRGLKEEYAQVRIKYVDRHPAFNFSRVAGTSALDEQIRKIGASIHVYGHQHINRHREVDGVLYISHCLGYHHEKGLDGGDRLIRAPKLIWPNNEV